MVIEISSDKILIIITTHQSIQLTDKLSAISWKDLSIVDDFRLIIYRRYF